MAADGTKAGTHGRITKEDRRAWLIRIKQDRSRDLPRSEDLTRSRDPG